MKCRESVAVLIENTDALKLPRGIGNAFDEIGHPNTQAADSPVHYSSVVC
jgi:hypothetical protein